MTLRIICVWIYWIQITWISSSSNDLNHEYLGCYTDNENRMLDEKIDDGSMTFELCYNKCSKYSLFGLQNRRECFCGNSMEDATIYKRRPENECNMACSGNTSQTCGGFWRMSVYRKVFEDITSTANTVTTTLFDLTSSNTDSTINSCQCPCSDVGHNKWLFLQNLNLTMQEMKEIIQPELELLDKELRVKKTNTSRLFRSRNSASDNRISSITMGYAGAIFVCVILFVPVLQDILRCVYWVYFKTKLKFSKMS